MLTDGGELALIDLREELIFSRSHLLWARNVPLSRLELRFARLVPRKTTRIVLVDDNDGLAVRAAALAASVAPATAWLKLAGSQALVVWQAEHWPW